MNTARRITAAVVIVAGACLSTQPAGAQLIQGLKIVASEPSNGAVSVPVSSQVRLTFSAPLDVEMDYSNGLPIALLDPNGDILSRISSYAASPDGLSLTLDISNPIDTDVSLIVTAARALDGAYLCLPYALNYTTRSESGNFSVSGDAHWGFTKNDASNCNYGPPIVIAALFDAPVEQGGKIVSAGVAQDYTFNITSVRPGTYWPYYFFDYDGDGEINPAFSLTNEVNNEVTFYDADWDGSINSVDVVQENVGGIDANLVIPGAVEHTILPETVYLDPVHPNPVLDVLTIPFSVNVEGSVEIALYDAAGRLCHTRQFGVLPVGDHVERVKTSFLAAGQYYVVVRSAYTRRVTSVTHIRH